MKLHNRLVKAAFWTDTDLIRQFSRDERLFYQGLWQLADDSGCLNNDPWAFKLHLFPLDSDILPETLADWTQKLIDAGKLVPYRCGTKPCLFVLNFSKHQTIHNASAPEVPLPEWISWQTYESNGRAGHYLVDVCKAPPSYIPLTPCLQVADAGLTTGLEVKLIEVNRIEEEVKLIEDSIAPAGVDCADAPIQTPEKPAEILKVAGSPKEPPTERTPGQVLYLSKFGKKRFATIDEGKAIARIEEDVGYEILDRALTWAAENCIRKVSAIRTTAQKMKRNGEKPKELHDGRAQTNQGSPQPGIASKYAHLSR